MKKIIIILVTTLILFSCDYQGPRLESVSKKESSSKNRFIGEYLPSKPNLKICDSVYSITNIWIEKFREDLTFYNYILEMKLHFNEDLNFKVSDTSFSNGYTQSRIILRNKEIYKKKFSFIFESKNGKCRDTITFKKAF